MKPAVEWMSSPSRPRRALALEPSDEIVGEPDAFERRAEHELARVEDERRLAVDLDELGEVLLRFLHVDERVARVVEDAEVAVDAYVDARRLEERRRRRGRSRCGLRRGGAGSSGRREPRLDSTSRTVTRDCPVTVPVVRGPDVNRSCLSGPVARICSPGGSDEDDRADDERARTALRGDPRPEASTSSPSRFPLRPDRRRRRPGRHAHRRRRQHVHRLHRRRRLPGSRPCPPPRRCRRAGADAALCPHRLHGRRPTSCTSSWPSVSVR